MSGRCLHSAAAEEWNTPKRPSSTVVTPSVCQRLCRGKYLLLHHSFLLDGILFLPPVPPLRGTRWHLPPVVPFVGPDGTQTFVVDVHCPYTIAGTRHGVNLATYSLVTDTGSNGWYPTQSVGGMRA